MLTEPSVDQSITIRMHESICEIKRAQWQALVANQSPFLDHGVLKLFEDTGCVGDGTGWMPLFLAAYQGEDEHLVGALPFYIKTHSAGEFVFDWGWADAAHRAGIQYYPKGLVAVPFTPVTGQRILLAEGVEDPAGLGQLMIQAICELADRQLGLSSVHFNFILPEERPLFDALDIPLRYGLQYHWYNRLSAAPDAEPYACFDDFLGRFRSKRRANLRRERRRLRDSGVTTRVIHDTVPDEETMHKMFLFYQSTIRKFYWGKQYLNEDFFLALPDVIPQYLHFVIASQGGRDFAGAFNLYKDNRLYGRYWGGLKEVEFTHFEVCMYTPITWCIEHGATAFEPGAGGEHKFERGFEPTIMYSAHHLHHPGLADAISDFLIQERAHVQQQVKHLSNESILKP